MGQHSSFFFGWREVLQAAEYCCQAMCMKILERALEDSDVGNIWGQVSRFEAKPCASCCGARGAAYWVFFLKLCRLFISALFHSTSSSASERLTTSSSFHPPGVRAATSQPHTRARTSRINRSELRWGNFSGAGWIENVTEAIGNGKLLMVAGRT